MKKLFVLILALAPAAVFANTVCQYVPQQGITVCHETGTPPGQGNTVCQYVPQQGITVCH
jgi:hypothetical protein